MRRLVALTGVGILAVLGSWVSGAGADPSTDTVGCRTVAGKYMVEEAPGHHGVQHAAQQGRGEGPCGFGNPPGHE